MRTFYLFKINKQFISLTRRSSYSLFKTLESIYNIKHDDLDLGYNLYLQIVIPFQKEVLNNYLFNKYKDNDHYTKYSNNHMINNFYTDERSKLIINNTFMVLKTSKIKPLFFRDFRKDKSIFVCDFVNKDYFWLEEMV